MRTELICITYNHHNLISHYSVAAKRLCAVWPHLLKILFSYSDLYDLIKKGGIFYNETNHNKNHSNTAKII